MIGTVLITGVCGFIGFHLSRSLLQDGYEVVGIDNLNDYYDPQLKKARLAILSQSRNFQFEKIDIKDKSGVDGVFEEHRPTHVINLAAQAGVRYSLENPYAYIDSNVVGFLNVLEACRNYPVKHLLYASSSSVYGGNKTSPFSVNHNVDHPISLYAATKKSNELMAHTYSHLYGIPTTGMRFFTVYGPWGRPDMAYFAFTKSIIEGRPIKVFNHGMMERDFTYIDDIVSALVLLMDKPPEKKPDWDEGKDGPSSSFAPYRIYNIGNNQPVQLVRFIRVLEEKIGRKAQVLFLDMQPGDVPRTWADISELERDIGYRPRTSIEEGLGKFVDWYKAFYRIQ